MKNSTQGWSTEQRKEEILRLYGALLSKHGLSRDQALQLMSKRTGYNIETVRGWVPTEGGSRRAPPDWATLDVLRYELGLVPVLDLVEWGITRGIAAAETAAKAQAPAPRPQIRSASGTATSSSRRRRSAKAAAARKD